MRAHNAGPPIKPPIGPIIGARVARALLRELGGWGRAVRAGRAEGLAPLLGSAVKAGLVRPPRELADRLTDKGSRTLARLRAGAVAEAARAASLALADAGVRHAVIKGAALAGLYGDRALRPCCDVDVLVEESTVPRASAALEAAGYRECTRGAVEASFAPPRDEILGVAIDLHFALAHRGQFTPDVDGMLERARKRDGIFSLSAEDDALVAAVDMARDCFTLTGRAASDLALLALVRPPEWSTLVARAKAWAAGPAAWAALRCARSALGAPVPGVTIDTLRPSPACEVYLRAWLDFTRLSPWRLARRGHSLARRRAAMAVLWPALVGGPARRAVFLARYALAKLRRRPL
jgi:hypothetical protein